MRWKGLILAGGRSSRMGTEKSSLLWEGETFLQRARRQLAAVVGEPNVLVSGTGPDPGGVPDLVPELGPLGGLASVVPGIAPGSVLLVVPVDMPLMREVLLAELQRASEPLLAGGRQAVHFRGRALPAALAVDGGLASHLAVLCQRGLAERDRSLRVLLERLRAWEIEPPPGRDHCFLNLNDPEELQRARRVYENTF